MLGNFFIWCAGSDTSILQHCPRSERIKHMGFGTLVLIPAVLAFVSMSYALSTIGPLQTQVWLGYLGGLVWAAIIFSFDRYIVSTHRKKLKNSEELQSPTFYLRFAFAFVLGVVISHPIVLLYFDGSITDQIKENVTAEKDSIRNEYGNRIMEVEEKIYLLDSLLLNKLEKRDAQAELVAREIDGEVLRNAKGEIVTTGIYGKGPSAENKMKQLATLDFELTQLRKTDSLMRVTLNAERAQLQAQRDSAIYEFSLSQDYLRRELALQQLKEENTIVGLTQFFLMLIFVLVDVLPVTFKTFSPFGLYDKILLDDSLIVVRLKADEREKTLQQVYNTINKELISNNDKS